MAGLDPFGLGQDYGPFHDIAELTDISRPGIFLQQVQGFLSQTFDLHPVLGIELPDKIMRQQRKITQPLAQWRECDGKHVQPVIQVLSQ